MQLAFVLNGRPVTADVRAGESLLHVLRDRFGITSVKNGCAPQGQCGCCLALVNGDAKVTCALAAEKVAGADILTLEGVPERDRDLLARSFEVAAGVQCGFCTPGIALRAYHLVRKTPRPARADIARAIDVHLCRCTGWQRVLDAIDLYARARTGEADPRPARDGGVGASIVRPDARALVLGERPFVADLVRPRMLRGAVLLSAHARAKVLRVDVARARALPGVVAIATAAEVPGKRWYGLLHDDWPGFVAAGEEVRCAGDVLAAVAAGDEATAREALRLVEVDVEPLPPVRDPAEALAPDAPRVNPRYENVLGRSRIVRGDADAALRASAHVVRGTWRTQRIEHLFLEPECALAEPDGAGGIRVFSPGQGVFDDRRQIAAFLGLPEEKVYVELLAPGGAFGGKEDMSVQAHAALLAFLSGRPVRVELSRDESIRMHPKRHAMTLDVEAGCDADGRLTAVRARIVGDTGAYASVGAKVLERAAGHSTGAYRVPNVDVEALAVATNNPPCGAMRGFGANQAGFAMEGALDLLAEKAGLDPWEMRWRNALRVGDAIATGQVLEKSVGLDKTLIAVKDAFYSARKAGRAVGIACGIKNSGLGNGVREQGKCRLRVERDGTVSLYNGFTEMGQGLFTVLAQIASEATGIASSRFVARVDSTFDLGCGQTTGSRATLLGGRAALEAARRLRAELDAGASLGDLAGRVFAGDVVIDDTTPLGADVAKPKTHTAFGFATQVCILDDRGRVERIVAAHDVGRAINPDLCRAQIEGSVHMGLGYALTEELPCRDGLPVTTRLRDIGVLRARDMPPVDVLLVEDPEPEGPFGAKGLGEIGLVPTAPAVAGALAAFEGKRRFTLPMKGSPASEAMSVGRIKGDREAWR